MIIYKVDLISQAAVGNTELLALASKSLIDQRSNNIAWS